MKILGIGNAIVDVICKVEDSFLSKNNLTKSTMKLVDETEFKKILSNNHPGKNYCVYNFGRAGYESSKENILFQKHLLDNRFKAGDFIFRENHIRTLKNTEKSDQSIFRVFCVIRFMASALNFRGRSMIPSQRVLFN